MWYTWTTVHHGMKHNYLGMWLDFSFDGQVQVQMSDYIDKMLAELRTDMDGIAASPAAENLFQVSNNDKKLSHGRAEMFCHNMAKIVVSL